MLAVSTMMLATSTYAWFTMNKEVTITGMEVKTHVGTNLLIQKSTLAGTAIEAQSGFVKDETQLIQAVLEPTSTVDGKNFFYTVDAKADGSKLHTPIGTADDATINYTSYADGLGDASSTEYANKFSQDYEASKEFVNGFVTAAAAPFYNDYKDKAVGYVDYVYQLKATNSNAEGTQNINLTRLDLTYNGATDGNKAYRAAVFVSDAINEDGTFADWSTTITPTVKAIYCPASATNFEAGKAVDGADSRNNVSYIGDSNTDTAVALATVPANSIKYYKVVVRLWIEGEDTTCNTSTFKALTDKWSLDMTMELDQGTGVTALGMETTPAAPASPTQVDP
jgi:hypothetical protein